ncbi:hypothetical protein O3P69_016313 [Scylla paramamosain]|uniref:Uncharacterized protein n=1 Tax=Scylla paramamosain TaxID=85552 RepID=A0AAW0TCY9_SCYPA
MDMVDKAVSQMFERCSVASDSLAGRCVRECRLSQDEAPPELLHASGPSAPPPPAATRCQGSWAETLRGTGASGSRLWVVRATGV